MNVPATINGQNDAIVLSARHIELVQRTVAADTQGHPDEFNLFIEASKRYRLDPLRKQISVLVFNKHARDKSKRRMAIVIPQEGLRVQAARQGDYRPASRPATIILTAEGKARKDLLDDAALLEDLKARKNRIAEIDEAYPVDPLNPHFIEKVETYLHKKDKADGTWYDVIGEAYWSEFAPIGDVWEEDPETTRKVKSGKKKLDGKWLQMPHLMLTKCATMQALRAGWPDQFGGVYGEEELHRAIMQEDMDATEIIEAEKENQRRIAIGARNNELPLVDHEHKLVFVAAGAFADAILRFARNCTELRELEGFLIRNTEGMNRYWAHYKNDALEMKKELEAIKANLAKQPVAA